MSARPRAALLAIGDELLAGAHPDLNSPFLASELGARGIEVTEAAVLGDDEDALAERMRSLAAANDLVLSSGGLGPTLDDVTRHAAARAAGVELVRSPEALERLGEWFAARGREITEANERQALVPAGAELLVNDHGSAPGFRVRVPGGAGAAWLACLPGPPPELQGVFRDRVAPWLVEEGLAVPAAPDARFHLVGLAESLFAKEAGDWMERGADPLIGVTAKGSVLTVRLKARAPEGESLLRLERRVAEFRERFGGWTFSETDPRLEAVLVDLLRVRGLTVALAESCSGGLATHLVTRVPGASDVLLGGFVTYSNAEKERALGVAPELLERHGAVSEEVAAAMAAGARAATGADLAVSVTGVAGPDGGTPEKPVGLVWFGLATPSGVSAEARHFPPSGRQAVQRFAAVTALDLLRRAAVATPAP